MNKIFSSKTGLVQITEDKGVISVKVGRGSSKGREIIDLPIEAPVANPLTRFEHLTFKGHELINAAKTYTGREYKVVRFFYLDDTANYYMILESDEDELVYRYTAGSEGGTNMVISAKGRAMLWKLKSNYQNSWSEI
jgi:hypothetical protein